MSNTKEDDQISEQLFWLVRLRWIAVAGIFVAVFFVDQILGIKLPISALCTVALILAFCNIIFYFIVKSLQKQMASPDHEARLVTNIQIFIDLLLLAVLVHFSGGIENPFIFYFIFHVIIASILLPRFDSFLQATFAVFLFLCITGLEYTKFIAHYTLSGYVLVPIYDNILNISGISFVFISTVYIAAYMATSVSGRLRKAYELLKEKDRIKSEYVLRVSHDIKENLAAVQSCIEPVSDGLIGDLSEQQRNLLARAKGRTKKLLTFVTALLEITRLNLVRELKTEEFSLRDMAKALSEDIAQRAQSKGLAFRLEIGTSAYIFKGVKIYIEEALSNILTNAIKYSSSGGEVKLKISEEDGYLLITIEDTGMGIAPDDIPHIFKEFFRAENAKRIEKMGTGLGLAIAKKIVEMHMGSISVKSQLGKGTKFDIHLPKRG